MLFDLKIFFKVVGTRKIGRYYWKWPENFFMKLCIFSTLEEEARRGVLEDVWGLRKIKTMCFWKFETWGVKILKTVQCFSFIFGCESWYFFHILFLINVSNVYLLFREKCVILFHVEICLVKNRLIFSVHFYLQINVKMRYYFLC